MKFQITLSVLLISLLAVGAYAQTDGERVNEQTQLRTQDQTRVRDTENCQDLDGDKAGGKNQIMNRGGGIGDTDQTNHNGDISYHGDGDGGVMGPFGPGSSDDGDKIFGDSADGAFAGDMLQHSWGPGMSGGGPFGPNEAHVGFGPAGSEGTHGMDSANSAVGQSRADRR